MAETLDGKKTEVVTASAQLEDEEGYPLGPDGKIDDSVRAEFDEQGKLVKAGWHTPPQGGRLWLGAHPNGGRPKGSVDRIRAAARQLLEQHGIPELRRLLDGGGNNRQRLEAIEMLSALGVPKSTEINVKYDPALIADLARAVTARLVEEFGEDEPDRLGVAMSRIEESWIAILQSYVAT